MILVGPLLIYLLLQVYLLPDPMSVSSPSWIFNFDASGSCPWRHCPTMILPPSIVPTRVQRELGAPIAFKQVGPLDSLVAAAVKCGQNLYVWQLRLVITSWGLKVPKKGSGKNGGVLKKDLCNILIDHFMPEASQDTKLAILAKMLGRASSGQDDEPELLEAVSKLSASEQDHYKDMVAHCVSSLEREHEKAMANRKPKEKKPAEKAAEVPKKDPPEQDPKKKPRAPEVNSDSEFPLAREKKATVDRAVPKTGLTRRPAPPELKELFPNIAGLYVKWLENDRRITIEFTSLQGSGYQRTKTSSWPFYTGIGPKEEAVFTVLKFVEMTAKTHFKGEDPSWKIPTREKIHACVTKLVNRLASEKDKKK